MAELIIPVGFNYAAACIDIHRHLNYREMTESFGYEYPSSINDILRGKTPSHPKGEAIWATYIALFGCRPPMTKEQEIGHFEVRNKLLIPVDSTV